MVTQVCPLSPLLSRGFEDVFSASGISGPAGLGVRTLTLPFKGLEIALVTRMAGCQDCTFWCSFLRFVSFIVIISVCVWMKILLEEIRKLGC